MITIFLPVRSGSQRIKNKNFRRLSIYRYGLFEIKIKQLVSLLNHVDRIIVSSDDLRYKEILKELNFDGIDFIERPSDLSLSTTTTQELISYVPAIIQSGVVLWTHVTSPFVTSKDYIDMLNCYSSSNNDSLMSVTSLRGFIWNKNEPINYNRDSSKWPFTQELEALYEVNSAGFISSISNYKVLNDRIGDNPKFFELSKLKSLDVDWPEDFELVEKILNSYENKDNFLGF